MIVDDEDFVPEFPEHAFREDFLEDEDKDKDEVDFYEDDYEEEENDFE